MVDLSPPTPGITDSDVPAPGRTRRNRGSEVVRDALVNAAIVEFAAHGFTGASTRRIAETAGAHQSQIKYHFDSKDDLWKRCLERLLDEVDVAIADAAADRPVDDGTDRRVAALEAVVRGFVRFAARRPELNRIMMHEATTTSDRLAWLVAEHVGPRRVALAGAWQELRDDGLAADIDPDAIYHTLIGAASLLYANAPEAQLMGIAPISEALVERHADALVTVFLRADPADSGKDRR